MRRILRPKTPSSIANPAVDPVFAVSVSADLDEDVIAIWRELEDSGIWTPYQSLAWYQAWLSKVAAAVETPFIVTARDGAGRATVLLPLVLSSRASVRIAKFAGGKHANFNMPLFRSGVVFTHVSMERLVVLTARARPDVDLLVFDALPQTWDGTPNPLVTPSARPHTAEASLVEFDRSPAWVLTAGRRRKLRANDRKFDKLGITLHRAQSQPDVARALAAFSAQKSRWFLDRGLHNSFEDPGVMTFFADLLSRPDSGGDLRYLSAPDGLIIAVAATLTSGRRASLMFVSFDASSPYAVHGPGKKLIREVVNEASRSGLAGVDFGLGEAMYKTSLGAQSQPSFVEVRPLTMKGTIAALMIDGRRKSKLFLKSHPNLLSMVLRIRKKSLSFAGLLRAEDH